jgi:hypothetical protein
MRRFNTRLLNVTPLFGRRWMSGRWQLGSTLTLPVHVVLLRGRERGRALRAASAAQVRDLFSKQVR